MATVMVVLDHGPVVPCDGCGRPVCVLHLGERANGVVTKRQSWVCEVPDCVLAAGPVLDVFAGVPLTTHNPIRCAEALLG